MNRTLLTILLSLAAGFAAGAWATSASQSGDTAGESRAAADYFDPNASSAERIEALERIVSEERDARLVLEEQMQGLYADLERIDVPELRQLLAELTRNRQAEEAQASGQQAASSGALDRRSGFAT